MIHAIILVSLVAMLVGCGAGPEGTTGGGPTNDVSTASVALSWDPNTEEDLAGYRVYLRTASEPYGLPIATLPATLTSFLVENLRVDMTHFFAVTAFDAAGNESGLSNEVMANPTSAAS
jgi:fibronectin type 3 domain-containing protein